MLDEISCKVEIRACHSTGIASTIPEVMTLSSLPAFKSPDTI